jgi:hypothetical protein
VTDERIAEIMGWSAKPAHVTGVLGGGPDDLPARVRAVAQAAAQEALQSADVLAEYHGQGEARQWASVGSWLYPGERIVVLRD